MCSRSPSWREEPPGRVHADAPPPAGRRRTIAGGWPSPRASSAPPSPCAAGSAALGVVGAALLRGDALPGRHRDRRRGSTSRLAEADTRLEGWERHGPALLVLGAFAAALAVGAARGATARGGRAGVCGLAALGLVLVVDLPRPRRDRADRRAVRRGRRRPGPRLVHRDRRRDLLLVVAAAGLLLAERRGRAGIMAAARGEGAAAPPARTSLARVRAHCLSLPETSERPSPAPRRFFIRAEARVSSPSTSNHHGAGRRGAVVAPRPRAPRPARPGRARPSATSCRRTSARAAGSASAWTVTSPDDIAGVIEDAYVARAPKALVRRGRPAREQRRR